MEPAIIEVELAIPPIGSCAFCLDQKGKFLLLRTPGVLQAVACTHAGAGSLAIYDGVPDERGFFAEAEKYSPGYWRRNGRELYRANPIVMGMWQLMAGAEHGLYIEHSGGHGDVAAIATIVYLPYRQRTVKPAEPVDESSGSDGKPGRSGATVTGPGNRASGSGTSAGRTGGRAGGTG